MNLCISQETRPLGGRRSPAKLIFFIAATVLLSAAVVFRGELAQLVSGTQQINPDTVGDLEEANKNLREPVQVQAIDPTIRKLDSDVLSDSADEEADETSVAPFHKLHSDVSSDSADEQAEDECPDIFLAGSSYEEGDVVEMNGVVYKCKSWPNSQWCSVTSYEPGSEKSEDVWEVIGHCHEEIEIEPVSSEVVVSEERMLQSLYCPLPYSSSSSYTVGDQVSVASGASFIVYECTDQGICNTEAPGSSSGWGLVAYCENTNSPTKAGTTLSPTASPTTPKSTVQVDSTLTWDIDCAALNSTTIIDVAKIIEESVYLTTDPNLPASITLQIVYVYELCGQAVGPHTGYPPSRRLQAQNEIKLYQVVSKDCLNCAEEIFNTTNAELVKVVEDGTLTTKIQTQSGGQIQAILDPVVNSTFIATTDRPTGVPTRAPSTPAPTNAPTNAPPVTPAPITPKPVASKSNKSSKTTPRPVTPAPTSAPTPAPITPRPVLSKSSKVAKHM